MYVGLAAIEDISAASTGFYSEPKTALKINYTLKQQQSNTQLKKEMMVLFCLDFSRKDEVRLSVSTHEL